MEECKVCLKVHEKCFNEEDEYIMGPEDIYLICSECSLVSKFYDGLEKSLKTKVKSIFLGCEIRNLDNKKVQKYRKIMLLLIQKLNDEMYEQIKVGVNIFVSLIIKMKYKNQQELITFLMDMNKSGIKDQCVNNSFASLEPIITEMSNHYDKYLKLLQQKCLNCGCCNGDGKLKKCRRCKSAYYCSLECNSADWKKHKKFCKC